MTGNDQGPVFAVLSVIVIAVLLFVGVTVLQGVDNSAALSAGTSATGTLTFSDNPTDGDTVIIAGDTYEFDNDTSVTGDNIAITIGVNASVSNTNFISKVNTLGTEAVTASQGTGDSTTLSATSGTAGNSITTTENSAALSFGSGTLSGGTEADDFYSASSSVSTGTQNALSMSTVLLIVIVAVAILSALFGIFAILVRRPN